MSVAPDDHGPERPLPPPTWRDVLDRFAPPERAGRVRAAAAVLGVVAVGAAGWWALRPPPAPPTEASLPLAAASATTAPATATSAPAVDMVVHAAGAVVLPGVHRVGPGSRVADLLAAAGGPAPDADLDRVNLAAALADGQRVWFPRVGEAAPPPVPGEGGPAPPGHDSPSIVDLNTATAEELEALPGIGPSIAAAIVEHRVRHGPFASVDDLLEVRGIGPARLEELRPLVAV